MELLPMTAEGLIMSVSSDEAWGFLSLRLTSTLRSGEV